MNKKLGNLEIIVGKNKEETIKQLAKELFASLGNSQNKNTLFLSSGGSALAVLEYLPSDVFGKNLTIGVLDERYDETNENNNFTQLTKTKFYKEAKNAGCGFINTKVKEGQTQEELAGYFEKEIKEWVDKNLDGKIIATIGVGADGHTSGIMPFPEDSKQFSELFEGDRLVVAYDAVGKNPFSERVTTTITFLRMLNRVFVLMTGKEKADAFFQIQKEGPLAETPARILKKLNGAIYIDEVVLKE